MTDDQSHQYKNNVQSHVFLPNKPLGVYDTYGNKAKIDEDGYDAGKRVEMSCNCYHSSNDHWRGIANLQVRESFS